MYPFPGLPAGIRGNRGETAAAVEPPATGRMRMYLAGGDTRIGIHRVAEMGDAAAHAFIILLEANRGWTREPAIEGQNFYGRQQRFGGGNARVSVL